MSLLSHLNGFRWYFLTLCLVFLTFVVVALVMIRRPDLFVWLIGASTLASGDQDKLIAMILDVNTKMFLGISGLVTVYVAFERIASSDRAHQHNRTTLDVNSAIADRTLDLNRKTQLDARIAKAIELLGSTYGRDGSEPRVEARLGAVLLIESVTQEKPTEFAGIARSLLLEYVRAQAIRDVSGRTDVSCALRVLFRLYKSHFTDQVLSLRKICFNGLYLGDDWTRDDLNWPRVDLTSTRFAGAQLIDVNLENAILDHTQFDGATLRGAMPSSLQSCSFDDTTLNGSTFSNAVISECDLRKATLNGCKLTDVRFLGGIDASEAKFVDAELLRVDFGNTSIHDTIWKNATLRSVDGSKAAANPSTLESLREAKTLSDFQWPTVPQDFEERTPVVTSEIAPVEVPPLDAAREKRPHPW